MTDGLVKILIVFTTTLLRSNVLCKIRTQGFFIFEKIFCCNETKINKLKFLSNQGLKSKLISNKKHKDDLIVFFEKKCNFSSADVEW
mgnify:CR=1 FL=1